MTNTPSDWEHEFERNHPVESFQEINHHWWVDCYDQIEKFTLDNVPLDATSNIIEYGSGSGNSSLRLANKVKTVTLLDSSQNALHCSRQLAQYHRVNNVEFYSGDIFIPQLPEKRFNLCWNTGVIEHYDFDQAKKVVKNMIKLTADDGYLCIGVPNFFSPAIIKAKLLSLQVLKPFTFWIKGYRLLDEKNYNESTMRELLRISAAELQINIEQITTSYVGSALTIETPVGIFSKLNKITARLFRKAAFLLYIVVKIRR